MIQIGTSAAVNVWSSIAVDWKVDVDTLALVAGVFSAILSTAGFIAGGLINDKNRVWWGYPGSKVIWALATAGIAVLPNNTAVFIAGVLAYAFALGIGFVCIRLVILNWIRKKHWLNKPADPEMVG